MTGWSLIDAIAMERRHVLAWEASVVRQDALTAKLHAGGHDQLAASAVELLELFRDMLKFSRVRLRQLEAPAAKAADPN